MILKRAQIGGVNNPGADFSDETYILQEVFPHLSAFFQKYE
jgi:hypothetical protein